MYLYFVVGMGISDIPPIVTVDLADGMPIQSNRNTTCRSFGTLVGDGCAKSNPRKSELTDFGLNASIPSI